MFGIFVFIIVIHIGGQFNERLASLVASRSVFLSDCLCKQCFCFLTGNKYDDDDDDL